MSDLNYALALLAQAELEGGFEVLTLKRWRDGAKCCKNTAGEPEGAWSRYNGTNVEEAPSIKQLLE